MVNPKYQGIITIMSADASAIEKTLAPDNLSNMTMHSPDTSLTIEVSASRLGTLINTVDDLLMNAKIAGDICKDH